MAAPRGIPGTFHTEHKQVRFKNNAHLETKMLSVGLGFPPVSLHFSKKAIVHVHGLVSHYFKFDVSQCLELKQRSVRMAQSFGLIIQPRAV